MATNESPDVDNVIDNMNNIDINSTKDVISQNSCNDELDYEAVKKDWGFELPELYKIVVKFYKGLWNVCFWYIAW